MKTKLLRQVMLATVGLAVFLTFTAKSKADEAFAYEYDDLSYYGYNDETYGSDSSYQYYYGGKPKPADADSEKEASTAYEYYYENDYH